MTELRRIAELLEARLPQAGAAGAAPGNAEAAAAVPLDGEGEKVFQALRTWRRERARKEGVSPYIVAYDRALREVAKARPGSIESLGEIPGFGPAKTAKYGPEILDVVSAA
ncbi:MAG TPA: HRDC domain-containing protein [Candidatus Thermoplasmatota archaeon]|nr:HRDC domain-containing protein [Candidatus Thermoplasmatota archaeon]